MTRAEMGMGMYMNFSQEQVQQLKQLMAQNPELAVLRNLTDAPWFMLRLIEALISKPNQLHVVEIVGPTGSGKGTVAGQMIALLEQYPQLKETLKKQGRTLGLYYISYGKAIALAKKYGLLEGELPKGGYTMEQTQRISRLAQLLVVNLALEMEARSDILPVIFVEVALYDTNKSDILASTLHTPLLAGLDPMGVCVLPDPKVQAAAQKNREQLYAEDQETKDREQISELDSKTRLGGEVAVGKFRPTVGRPEMIHSVTEMIKDWMWELRDKIIAISDGLITRRQWSSREDLDNDNNYKFVMTYFYRYLRQEWNISPENMLIVQNEYLSDKELVFMLFLRLEQAFADLQAVLPGAFIDTIGKMAKEVSVVDTTKFHKSGNTTP